MLRIWKKCVFNNYCQIKNRLKPFKLPNSQRTTNNLQIFHTCIVSFLDRYSTVIYGTKACGNLEYLVYTLQPFTLTSTFQQRYFELESLAKYGGFLQNHIVLIVFEIDAFCAWKISLIGRFVFELLILKCLGAHFFCTQCILFSFHFRFLTF